MLIMLFILSFIIFLIIALIIDFFSSYDMAISDVIIVTFVFSCYMFYVIYQNNKIFQTLEYYKNSFLENTEYILHLIYPSLKHHIENSNMVDINSIQENGFDFVESFYLKIYLKDEIKRGNIEAIKLPQKNIILYKAKVQSEIPNTTTTYLTVD